MPEKDPHAILFSAQHLRRFTTRVFEHFHVPPADAALAADVLAYSLDIAIEEDVDAFIETLETSGKSVKNLYNCAGTTFFGPVTEIGREAIDNVLQSNMIGLMLFMVFHPVARSLRASETSVPVPPERYSVIRPR